MTSSKWYSSCFIYTYLLPPAISAKWFWSLIATGVERVYSDAYLGTVLIMCYVIILMFSMFFEPRFGLLHRIPPIPENREPGALPAELVEHEEFEEQQLFVPADLTDGVETSEQAERRLQWEEWERENHARNYAAAVNQTSPSAYDLSSDSVRLASYHGTDPASEKSAMKLTEAFSAGTLVQTPTARNSRQQPDPIPHVKQSPRPSTPVHTTLVSPRALTPTQNQPLGYHVNSESKCHFVPLAIKLMFPRNWYSSSYTFLGRSHARCGS